MESYGECDKSGKMVSTSQQFRELGHTVDGFEQSNLRVDYATIPDMQQFELMVYASQLKSCDLGSDAGRRDLKTCLETTIKLAHSSFTVLDGRPAKTTWWRYVYSLREHFDCIYAMMQNGRQLKRADSTSRRQKAWQCPRCHLDQILRRRGLHMCYKTPVVTTIAKSNNDI